MRTAIYARFSSQLQKDSSIEDQVRVCAERAAREGWTVTEVFSDYAISGAVRDRPGLNALLAHVEAGHADQVLAEALDRISRDQEDQANLFKRVRHAGARIFTLSEGTIDELQIGFKGTIAALYGKDLADKIRRGQSGRVALGRVPGNIVYGYRKVIRVDERGEPVRGLREIDQDQAEVVRRIYREYLAGESPLAIARRLNAEGVPSPSGGKWNVSVINGDTVRGNGILCNPIYAGELVYNRTTMVRDPQTRRRVPRSRPQAEWQRQPVPELRIVDQASWDAVRERKAEWSEWTFTSQKRPKRLLSGLVECGRCGGNMGIIGAGKFGCTAARRAGTCNNRRTIEADVLERKVLSGLEAELLSPERVRLAHQAYREDRARLDREARAAGARQRKRAAELEQQIERLVAAIAAGAGDVPEVVEKLRALRAERSGLQDAMGDELAARVITLHPAFACAYEAAVKQIVATIAGDQPEHRDARNAIRALVDRVILTPKAEGRGMDIDVEGRLEAMLDLGRGNSPKPRRGTVQGVAEERFGLDRTLRRVRV
jgi:site-specific DNA recombinase